MAEPTRPAPQVLVIGGGIAGLAAAAAILASRPDAVVTVLEAADRVGGKLRREQVAGAWIDVGAEAMLARRPEGLAAARDAGLSAAVLHPLTTAALIRNRGRNRPLPARTLIGVPTDLAAVRAADVLSNATLDRIAAEPDGGPYPPLAGDISVGDLIAQRFGDEVVDRLVDPLLGGVYAGHARAISLQAAIPALARRLQADGGSLLVAAAANAAAAAAVAPDSPVFASIDGGMGRLPAALAEQLRAGGATVSTGTVARAVRRSSNGFVVTVGAVPTARELVADAVVIATPAAKSAGLLAELAPTAAAELAGIETASMAVITLAFDRTVATAAGFPPGSGLLVPAVEGLAVKAMTFSSQKWPGVGEADGVWFMRASVGRAGEERDLQRSDAELVDLVRRELAIITGVQAEPLDTHVQRWGGALPQYAVGHVDKVARIRTAVAGVPGLAVCGAAYDGVGIPAVLASAQTAADRVLAGLWA